LAASCSATRTTLASAQHIDGFLSLGVEAVGLRLVGQDAVANDRPFYAQILSDLTDRRIKPRRTISPTVALNLSTTSR
jgi:hypothetical protein